MKAPHELPVSEIPDLSGQGVRGIPRNMKTWCYTYKRVSHGGHTVRDEMFDDFSRSDVVFLLVSLITTFVVFDYGVSDRCVLHVFASWLSDGSG